MGFLSFVIESIEAWLGFVLFCGKSTLELHVELVKSLTRFYMESCM